MSKKDIKSLEERAKNYANEVQQITDFVEQVRQTPDVYIGKIAGNRAFLTMAREIIQNKNIDKYIISLYNKKLSLELYRYRGLR